MEVQVKNSHRDYLLRPELVESFEENDKEMFVGEKQSRSFGKMPLNEKSQTPRLYRD